MKLPGHLANKPLVFIGATPSALDAYQHSSNQDQITIVDNFKRRQTIDSVKIQPLQDHLSQDAAYIIFTAITSFRAILTQLATLNIKFEQIYFHQDKEVFSFPHLTSDFFDKLRSTSPEYRQQQSLLAKSTQYYFYNAPLSDTERESIQQFDSHYIFDTAPESLRNQIQDIVAKLPQRPYQISDHAQGYIYTDTLSAEDETRLQNNLMFYQPSQQLEDALQTLVEQLNQRTALLDAGMCIGNIRVFEYQSGESFGSAAWHFDHLPIPIFKMLYYLGEVNEDSGTTKVKIKGEEKSLQGQAGSFLFFNPTLLEHKAHIPRQSNKRKTIEITLVPAGANYLNLLASAGSNSVYPMMSHAASPPGKSPLEQHEL